MSDLILLLFCLGICPPSRAAKPEHYELLHEDVILLEDDLPREAVLHVGEHMKNHMHFEGEQMNIYKTHDPGAYILVRDEQILKQCKELEPCLEIAEPTDYLTRLGNPGDGNDIRSGGRTSRGFPDAPDNSEEITIGEYNPDDYELMTCEPHSDKLPALSNVLLGNEAYPDLEETFELMFVVVESSTASALTKQVIEKLWEHGFDVVEDTPYCTPTIVETKLKKECERRLSLKGYIGNEVFQFKQSSGTGSNLNILGQDILEHVEFELKQPKRKKKGAQGRCKMDYSQLVTQKNEEHVHDEL